MLETPKRVLLVTPHPDDAEGGCGGAVAKWIKGGAEVVYVLCTNGDKGTSDYEMSPERLAAIREKEQSEAAHVLGVKDVVFLRHPDGTLEDNLEFRSEVVREIRRHKPDVVMCLDPFRSKSHTHRDHRISGQVTMDAAFTYAWRRHHFPEHVTEEGLEPHSVKEIYLWGSEEPDTFVDVSETLELKLETLLKHASQITDPERARQWIPTGAQRMGERANLDYAEGFRVIRFAPDPLLME